VGNGWKRVDVKFEYVYWLLLIMVLSRTALEMHSDNLLTYLTAKKYGISVCVKSMSIFYFVINNFY
jgi:hypothetical protein